MSTFKRLLADLQAERKRAQAEVGRLDDAISAVQGLVRRTNTRRNYPTAASPRRRRTLSAAARRRISLAQKARWAKVRQMKKAA
jgi:hypothetical protein